MPKPHARHGDAPTPDAVARWIRRRRVELNLTVSQVASTLRVTPAFISMIESGKKRPGAEVAAKLAKQLKDDEGLLLRWISMYRPRSLERARAAALEMEEFLSLHEARTQVPHDRGGLRASDAASTAKHLPALSPSALKVPALVTTQIPVLPEGSDPDTADHSTSDLLPVHLKLLPPNETLDGPFAYRLTSEGAARAKDVLRANDVVVLTRDCWPATKDEVYAIRLDGRIVLSRVQVRDRMLLLVSADAASEGFEMLPIGRSGVPRELVARVALVVRTWR